MLDVFNHQYPSEMAFEQFVADLTEQTKSIRPKSENYHIIENTKKHLETLETAFTHLSKLAKKKKLASSGVEWFLDNYYAIQKAVEIIRDDLPEDYFKKLPSLKEKSEYPRIYHIAKNIIAYYQVELVRNDLHEFLNAYQEEIPLQMSELWALPLMLRLSLIEILSGKIFDLIEGQDNEHKIEEVEFSNLESDEIIARSLRTLLRFDRIDWKKLFEKHAAVNKILQDDPMNIYKMMDFETRDQYRKKVEKLAEKSDHSEIEVAKTAIALANESNEKADISHHVGFYLVDDGEADLIPAVNFKYSIRDRLSKFFFDHKTYFYLGSISLITLLVIIGLFLIGREFITPRWALILIGFLSIIPASSVAVNLINSVLTATLPPRTLPKLDFRKWVPKKHRTVVTIPALLTNKEEIDFLLQQLELHYLANKDQNIGFALLSDYSDAEQETMPEDGDLLRDAVTGIDALNERYQGDKGRRPFYLFHRRRQWNPKENLWMGWERKRGKLTDFNSFLMEGFEESFSTIIGDLDFMKRVRYVITVDADTILPRDSAKSLIATLAHPLNKAEFKEETSEVTRGYTILQPRTEVKPTSVVKSTFTRIFAGDLGLDLYTRAVSDVYQDLFGDGIYVGKGIYDVAAFHRSLEGKAPDNALLSHDLFEGLQGRAGLVSDIVFFEEYPPNYSSQVNRLHRWVRGDWQLIPWIFPKVPLRGDKPQPNPFSAINRWKILDNLRRSMLSPAILVLLVSGLLFFDQRAWVWTLAVLFVSAFPLFNNIVSSLSSRFLKGAKANIVSNIKTAFLRWIFWLVFLPYESLIMIDAILTTLVRVYISHKRLLQWQTSAHTVRLFGKERKITTIWQRMIGGPLISVAIGVLLYLLKPAAFWANSPLLLMWFISPQIAYWISLRRDTDKKEVLNSSELLRLKKIARRTWLFFEHFIGPEDHWLPPDHFQEDPNGTVAHRTSPTNIGLMLLSSAAAYDFGYIGVLDFIYRMNYTFETLDGMEKYRGHLFNWYDTRSLDTLSPRYVSSVDSGNYAVSLIGLYQTLKDLSNHTISPSVLFQGAYDSLDIFCDLVKSIENNEFDDLTQPLLEHSRNLQQEISGNKLTDTWQMIFLEDFDERLSDPMNTLIKEILFTDKIIDPEVLRDLRYWSEAIFKHLTNIRQQIEIIAPWMQTWRDRPDFFDEIESDRLRNIFAIWEEDRALRTILSDLPDRCGETINLINEDLLKDELANFSLDNEQSEKLKSWLLNFVKDLEISKNKTQELFGHIQNLMAKIDFYLERMEFNFLFDKRREVFYLGYQVDSGRLDKNHYDLLASEARTTSLFAISQNEVPRSHWLHMARPFTAVSGMPTLISWNGSMFEYLMPNLFTRTYPETLLHQTNQGVVKAQIEYGKQNNVPWGISESSYYRFDQADNYQYKGFGVPSIGRKRGLSDDLVIAPYASFLAVGVNPKSVLRNLDALEETGALGHFGYYESIDYTRSRLPIGKDKAIIKSYMVHHQGMIMVSLANYLNQTGIVDRVHNDPRIQSTELLLQEQIPEAETMQTVQEVKGTTAGIQENDGISIDPWAIDVDRPGRAVNLISNGNLKMVMTDSGSGYLGWKDIALTRWRQDATLDPWGIWFYVQDLDAETVWSIGQRPVKGDPQEYQVIFAPHMVEIRKLIDKTRTIMQTTIMPNEDVCLHKIKITNQSNKKRQYRVLSYGEVVLAPQDMDQQHPAFNKLFIESDYDDDLKMLHFHRRKRSSKEENRGMAHLIYDDQPSQVEYESDREKFIGRGRNLSNPIAVASQQELAATVGITLDPIFSMGKRFSLNPNQTVTLTYLTMVAEDKESAQNLARSVLNMTKIKNVFSSAESHSEKLLRTLGMERNDLLKFQRLLSRVLYPIPELRPEASLLQKNELGQSGLWPFGISGDYPILLVMINNKNQIDTFQETLLAHTYWRKLGLMIDLVVLNTKDTGYANELNEKILQAINIMDSQNWVNRRGGIFVLTASQMEHKAITLIKTAARVVIDSQEANIEGILRKTEAIAPHLPPFTPTEPGIEYSIEKEIAFPDDLVMDNDYGGFTRDGREYQIKLQVFPKTSKNTGQMTPMPWVNVIANENFGFLVTESGGGYTWSVNSGENRLTPWTNDPIIDPAGESLYLRDEITGKVWSPTPYPAGEGVNYLVRHGQGYTIFESYHHGLKQELKLFADAEAPVKIIELKLTNETDKHRRLTATYYVEWVLGPNREKSKAFIVPDYHNQSETLFARNTYSAEFSDRVAFLTSGQSIHGLTTDRREFLGSPGDRHSPAALKRVGLSGRVEAGLDPCAVIQTHLNFNPGEQQTVRFMVGQGADVDQAKQLASMFSKTEKIEESWSKLKDSWETFLRALQVKTPDPVINLMLNRWLPYQTLSSRIWGRSGFFQSSGAYGFRDQLQDVMALLVSKPVISREHILRAAQHQFEAGDVLHWWHPPSGRGVRTRITDDLLWLVYVTAEYVRKTGDTDILKEKVPFIVGQPLKEDEHERYGHYETTEKSFTIFEHCRRALEYGDTSGPHKLPLIGSGDWNDGMNRVGIEGQGESVWLGWFLYENHMRFAELCKIMKEVSLIDKHQERAEEIKEVINQVAWDGEWYLRGYYDDGTPLGSHRNEECQIDSLPQSWSVITQGAPVKRQKMAMQSVKDRLVQDDGQLIRLFTPPFDKTEQDPGYIKGYPPGVRENGGQYTHAAIWSVWAMAELGLGNQAYKYFKYLTPATHSLDKEQADLYRVEPYVVAADIYSTPPFIGRGGWTWYTGSSGWLYRLGAEMILGFKLEGDRFRIDPCIPDQWDGFDLTYHKNGSTYKVRVKNPDHVETGVKKISIDGEEIDLPYIHLAEDQADHEIVVIMGK